jgi:preprotein translocase subunit SecG
MNTVVLVLHLLIAVGMVGVVLMQRSEGGALGIGGGGNSLISGRGAADVLARITGFLALAFFITSISLTVLGGGAKKVGSGVLDEPARPSFFESIFPKKEPDIVTAPSTLTPQFPATPATSDAVTPASAPAGDIVPPPSEAIQRAGPIDASPLPIKPTPPAAKLSTPAPKPAAVATPAPKPAAVTPPKPTAAAAPKPATKPAVGATKPATAPAGESGEPAAPVGRAGPDE